MKITFKTPQQSITGFYTRSVVTEDNFNLFKSELKQFNIDVNKSEEKKQTAGHLSIEQRPQQY